MVYFSRDYTPHDRRFLAALAGTDHSVSFLRLERRGPVTEERPLPEGIQMIDWWGGRRPLSWWDWPRAAWEVRRELRQRRPDLVHAGPVQPPALLAALAGFRPLLTMSWGSDLLRGARRGPGRWAARWTLSRSDSFACDCEAVRRVALELGVPEDRIFVFPWGVNLSRFRPGRADGLRAHLGIPAEAFVVLSTRSWERQYGLPELVEGFIEAAKSGSRLHLVLLSGGSLESDLRARLRQAGLMDRVVFPGQVSNDRLPDYYRACDLYVSASHSDGSSISLLEAMASGLPCLVSDIAGNREWVTPGETGWWFPVGRADALTEGILRAVSGEGELPAMGMRARAVAEVRADWSKNFPVLLDAYRHAYEEGRQ